MPNLTASGVWGLRLGSFSWTNFAYNIVKICYQPPVKSNIRRRILYVIISSNPQKLIIFQAFTLGLFAPHDYVLIDNDGVEGPFLEAHPVDQISNYATAYAPLVTTLRSAGRQGAL